MQEYALQEKQILLLTRNNPQLEEHVEQQVRELTLLPLHIKYLPHIGIALKKPRPPATLHYTRHLSCCRCSPFKIEALGFVNSLKPAFRGFSASLKQIRRYYGA
jgi:hypothetical protein